MDPWSIHKIGASASNFGFTSLTELLVLSFAVSSHALVQSNYLVLHNEEQECARERYRLFCVSASHALISMKILAHYTRSFNWCWNTFSFTCPVNTFIPCSSHLSTYM